MKKVKLQLLRYYPQFLIGMVVAFISIKMGNDTITSMFTDWKYWMMFLPGVAFWAWVSSDLYKRDIR